MTTTLDKPRTAEEQVRDEIARAKKDFAPHAGEKVHPPFIMIIASAPRMGKGVFLRALKNKRFFPENTSYLMGDPFLYLVNEQDRFHSHHPEKTGIYKDKFYALRQKLAEEAIMRGENVIVESHCRDMGQMKKLLNYARLHGYEVISTGISGSPEALFPEGGGKDFKPGYEKERLKQRLEWMKHFAQQWNELASRSDFSSVYDVEYVQEGSRLKGTVHLIADRGKGEARDHIYHEDFYDQFQRWQKANTSATEPAKVLPERKAARSSDNPAGVGGGAEGGGGENPRTVVAAQGSAVERLHGSVNQDLRKAPAISYS